MLVSKKFFEKVYWNGLEYRVFYRVFFLRGRIHEVFFSPWVK